MDTETYFADAKRLVEIGDLRSAIDTLEAYLHNRLAGLQVEPGTDTEAARLTDAILTRIRLDQGTKNFQA